MSRENVRASTSHNPMGLHGLLQGLFYLSCNNNRTLVYSRTDCLSLEGAGSQTYSRDQPHMDWIILKKRLCVDFLLYIHVVQVSKSPHFLKVSMVFTNSAHHTLSIAQYSPTVHILLVLVYPTSLRGTKVRDSVSTSCLSKITLEKYRVTNKY
jgi:hypothetical protein